MTLGALTAAAGYALTSHCAERMSRHAGYFLVAARDEVRAPIAARPRRAVVAVVDGLRLDAALGMRSARRLRDAGACARTRVGLPSVSRPVYAVLSTGLEQDRTGARNNDDTSALAAESVWEVARGAGLAVEGRSELTWWREMFPRGFDRFVVNVPARNLFLAPLTADLTLVHPVYVDEAGHDHGGASGEYRAAVRRADRELSGLLDGMDLRRDLVVLTADHGHRDAGGHGGASPEVAEVLTCFAGAGVARDASLPRSDSRVVAPALAALLGLRFPEHLRAGGDALGFALRLLDPAVVGPAYRDDRARAVDDVRAQNLRALRAWGADSWDGLYARERGARRVRAALLGVALLGAVAALARRLLPRGERLAAVAWSLAVGGCYAGAYALLAGGLDLSSLNRRGLFIRNTLAAGLLAVALGALAHVAARRSATGLGARAWLLVALTAAANALHVGAYGWPMGFPLPGPRLYYAAFLAGAFLVTAGLFAAAAEVAEWRARR